MENTAGNPQFSDSLQSINYILYHFNQQSYFVLINFFCQIKENIKKLKLIKMYYKTN